jgi:undecaprenyl-phosphate 4-deoxy-4-formamido-L-arabinose transferase
VSLKLDFCIREQLVSKIKGARSIATIQEPSHAIIADRRTSSASIQSVSVVVPVYQGERTLDALLAEIAPLVQSQETPGGRHFRVNEVILVHDGAVDRSHAVMEELARRYQFVTTVWLSRNYGQHPATLAGMAASSGDWVATLDDDGQQAPADIAKLLDRAIEDAAALVYAKPVTAPAHARWRNAMSVLAKLISAALIGNPAVRQFNSFRLVRGDIARSLAAYCGNGVYLDVALSWVVDKAALCPVALRPERGRASGYTFRKLMAHFGRLMLTAGTRPLRIISILGSVSVLLGIVISAYAFWAKIHHEIPVQGYTSLIIVVCFFSGIILSSLGVIAEYLALVLTATMGKPLYVTVSRPTGPDSSLP